MINGLKKAAALGAATVALATGAVVGTVGTASAAPQHHRPPVASHHCVQKAGYWSRVWHPAYRDRHHHRHAGYWSRVWHPAHRDCRR
ncbi:hypothetical protein [Streptomyces cyslabdanicus]|uniref:hypothetical protein n=1 Tax=Streptomyces cyslabdanicus TaxID=1470456 RepID=UPI0040442CCC